MLGFGGNQHHYVFKLKVALDYTVPLQLQAHCGKHCPVTPYKRQFQEAEPLSCPVSKAQSPFQVSSTTKLHSCKGLKSAGEIFLPYLSPFSRGFCDTLTGLGVPGCSLCQRHSQIPQKVCSEITQVEDQTQKQNSWPSALVDGGQCEELGGTNLLFFMH